MRLNNLGNNKKSLLKNHKIAFDQEKMWFDINRELSNKKKKNRLILFFAFLLCASFSALFISHYRSHLYKSQDFSNYSMNDLSNTSIPPPSAITDICLENEILCISDTLSAKLIQRNTSTKVVELFHASNHNTEKLSTKFEKFDSLHQINIFAKPTQIELLPMLEFSKFLIISNLSTPDIDIIQKQTLKHKLLLNMGIGYVTRALISDNTRESTEFRNLKNETEDVLEQISLGIEYKYITNSKLLYGMGIGLRQITERFQHKYRISEDFSNVDNIAFSKVTSYDYNYFNEYRFLDISASIGYQFNLRNNIDFYFDAGVSYTLVSFYNGNNLDQNKKPQHFNDTKFFTKQIQSNLNAIVSFSLSKNYAISFSNSITFGMNGINPQNSILSQRYNIYSANIGIIRSFGH